MSLGNKSAPVKSVDSGMDTTRVPAPVTEAERRYLDERDAKALRYLRARDALDVAEMLGLGTAPPPPVTRCRCGTSLEAARSGTRRSDLCRGCAHGARRSSERTAIVGG